MCTARFNGRHGGGGGGSVCLGGVCLEGMSAQGGVSRGVCQGGVHPLDPEADTPHIACRDTHPLPMHTGIQPPPPSPWTEGMTHACENITLPRRLNQTQSEGNSE